MKSHLLTATVLVTMLIFMVSCNFPRPTATPQAGIPVTGASSTPPNAILTVQTVTACRTGPGRAYDGVFKVKPGSSYVVVAKHSSDNFWIITNPVGGTCWVSGRNATVTGNTASLPEVPVPPKPTVTPNPTPTP